MKKILLIIISATLVYLIFTYSIGQDNSLDNLDGSVLNIGVLGTTPSIKLDNVDEDIIHEVKLYDALMLTEEVFQDTSL
ncbi:hypothetical protein V1503_18720 [Bacillus sp. SCS-151]|uniref:hypothetical protein n=1 Tax=Nanhaiella sioensis TaxID=3115293 RepID=UPI00397C9850